MTYRFPRWFKECHICTIHQSIGWFSTSLTEITHTLQCSWHNKCQIVIHLFWRTKQQKVLGFRNFKASMNEYLKVHKHEIILNFFLPKSNPYMPLENFRKKFRFFSFDFRQNFEVRTFSRWLSNVSIRGTKFYWRDILNFFFFKMFIWVLLDEFLNSFSKFGFFIVEICFLVGIWVIFKNYSMRTVHILHKTH
jgi:hypothetical protein